MGKLGPEVPGSSGKKKRVPRGGHRFLTQTLKPARILDGFRSPGGPLLRSEAGVCAF